MNEKIVKLLQNTPVVVSACVGIGAITGIAVELTKDVLEKRKQKSYSQEVDNLRDEVVRKVQDELQEHKNHIDHIRMEYNTLRNDTEKKVGLEFSKPDISELVDYTKFSRKGEAVVTENGKPVTDEEPQEVNAPTVFEIISVDDFLKETGNGDGYTSVVGTWFPQDGILAGWNENMEEKDPRSTIGEEALAMFDDPEVDLVYVRNTHLKVLFEIMKSSYSFDEVVDELKEAEEKE